MTAVTKKIENASSRQLALSLPQQTPTYTRESYIRAQSNGTAWRTCEAWLDSEEPALIICGPAGAGKTHLAYAAAELFGAAHVMADIFVSDPAPRAEVVIVDDMPATQPKPFLAKLETCAAAGKKIILVGEGHPSSWALGLKDLRTRLEAMPRAILDEPDEELIEVLIAKAFRDRQIVVAPNVIKFASLRLPRTFAAVHSFVATADKAALEEKRKITTPFVQKFIDVLSEVDQSA